MSRSGDNPGAAGLVPAAETPPTPGSPADSPSELDDAGVLTAPPTVACIAPVRLDGGTRFALDIEPEEIQAAPAAFRRLLAELREPTSREQEQRWRAQGGRSCRLPVPREPHGSRALGAEVTVSGGRRESLTFHVPYVVHVRMNVETGSVRLQLRAPVLWAEGYERTAARWLDLVLWWVTGQRCTLEQSHAARWRTTGIELCSDFVGLDWTDHDTANFVGFRASDIIRRFSCDNRIETINMGTRRSPVSLCLYDKDVQIARAKGGDDSVYRAMHLAHGWDGKAPRRRVEFRVSGRGLSFVDDDTGECLDFRDPYTLAQRESLTALWALLAEKKRLVMPDSSTRKHRCVTDPRWTSVQECAGIVEILSFRQTRESQTDAWHEATRRAQRDVRRALHRVAALHDVEHANVRLPVVLQYVQEASTSEERADGKTYQETYRRRREAYLGEEIRTLGSVRWAKHVPGDWESD